MTYFNIYLIYMYDTYQNNILQRYTRHICIIPIWSILVKDSSKARNTTNQYFNNMLENDLADVTPLYDYSYLVSQDKWGVPWH